MNGLNPEPCKSYALADRLLCAQCGVSPEIVSVSGDGNYTIKVSCHGEEETRMLRREELVHTQFFFEEK